MITNYYIGLIDILQEYNMHICMSIQNSVFEFGIDCAVHIREHRMWHCLGDTDASPLEKIMSVFTSHLPKAVSECLLTGGGEEARRLQTHRNLTAISPAV